MILLTGASGFIGRHLLSGLMQEYGKDGVLALTSKPLPNNNYLLHHDFTFDEDYFIQNGYGQQIHTIIHAGAFTPKNAAEANDRQKCNSNILNTDKLLNARFPALKKIIYLSTLDVYAPCEIISETSPVDPAGLYGASKLYSEKMIGVYADKNNLIYQVLRIGHVYGPGEEAYQKILPVTIKKLLQNESPEIWGTGNEIRSFIYISDVVRAVLQAVKSEKSEGVINLTGGRQVTVNELVEKLIKLSGKKAEIIRKNSDIPGKNFIFDNGKMKEVLLPEETELETGLFEEWEYMKNIFA